MNVHSKRKRASFYHFTIHLSVAVSFLRRVWLFLCCGCCCRRYRLEAMKQPNQILPGGATLQSYFWSVYFYSAREQRRNHLSNVKSLCVAKIKLDFDFWSCAVFTVLLLITAAWDWIRLQVLWDLLVTALFRFANIIFKQISLYALLLSVECLQSLKQKMTFPSCRERLLDDKNMTVRLFEHGRVVWSVIKGDDFGYDFGFDYFCFCRAERVMQPDCQSSWLASYGSRVILKNLSIVYLRITIYKFTF